MEHFRHEQIYRGAEAMSAIKNAQITICGVGALGSNLAFNLARIGVGKITLVDKDRVEQHNVGTQIYSREDIGGKKADILRNQLYRETGVEIVAHAVDLNERNAKKLLGDARIIVDAFDNSQSRRLVSDFAKAAELPCLHVGFNANYGEIVWNDKYVVPSDVGEDQCNYPLARNMVMLIIAVASESLLKFVATGEKESYSITLGDLAINREFER